MASYTWDSVIDWRDVAAVDQLLAASRAMESGGNYTIEHKPPAGVKKATASGAYGMLDSTWQTWARQSGVPGATGYRRAKDAPPAMQDAVARWAMQDILRRNGGRVAAIPVSWYIGSFDQSRLDKVPSPEYGNKVTPRAYATSWLRKASSATGGSLGASRLGVTNTALNSTDSGSTSAAQIGTDFSSIYEAFGGIATYLDHPEIGPLLKQAAAEGWTKEKLQAQLTRTDWWKATQESIRLWEIHQKTDPATAAADVDAKIEEVQRSLTTLGVTLSDEQVKTLATQSLRLGWSDNQLGDAVAAEARKNPAVLAQLRAGGLAQQARKMAGDYGVPLSAGSLDSWITKMLDGSESQDTFKSYLVKQASSMFPSIADDLARGFTVREIADPYTQVAASTLELDPNTVDFTEPRWNQALNFVDQQGKRRPMTLQEWQKTIRTDPSYGWEYTGNARGAAAATVETLGKLFGKV